MQVYQNERVNFKFFPAVLGIKTNSLNQDAGIQ